jgi:predicted aspartyl protease
VGALQLSEVLKATGYLCVQLQRNAVGHLLAQASVSGRSIACLVDTGASRTLISLDLARQLDLSISLHPEKGGGAGGATMDVYVAEGTNLSVGGVPVQIEALLAMDLRDANVHLVSAGINPIEAILGLDALERHSAVIDYSSYCMFLRS